MERDEEITRKTVAGMFRIKLTTSKVLNQMHDGNITSTFGYQSVVRNADDYYHTKSSSVYVFYTTGLKLEFAYSTEERLLYISLEESSRTGVSEKILISDDMELFHVPVNEVLNLFGSGSLIARESSNCITVDGALQLIVEDDLIESVFYVPTSNHSAHLC